MAKKHISHTGYYAGVLYCGKSRKAMIGDGESSSHWGRWVYLDGIDLCEDCRQVEAESEAEAEAEKQEETKEENNHVNSIKTDND